MKKRALATVLTLVMVVALCVGVLPVGAVAASEGEFTFERVIAEQYEEALFFSGDDGQELAAVKENGKWGYIDTTGKVVIDFQYDVAGDFREGKAIVGLDGGFRDAFDWWEEEYYTCEVYEFGWIDCGGNFTWLNEYYYDEYYGDFLGLDRFYIAKDEFDGDDSYRNGMLFYNGFLNIAGSSFYPDGRDIDFSFLEAEDIEWYKSKSFTNWGGFKPAENYACIVMYDIGWYSTMTVVKFDDNKNIIDHVELVASGGERFRPVNDGIMPVGYFVGMGSPTENEWGFIRINENNWHQEYEYWGDIKQLGDWVIEPAYSNFRVSDVYGDYRVFNDGLVSVADMNGKWGAIDKQGKIVVPFIYDYLYGFQNGLSGFEKNGKMGFIDASGNVVIQAKYAEVSGFGDKGYAVVSDGYSQFIVDRQGNEYIVPGLNIGSMSVVIGSEFLPFEENGLWGYYKLTLPQTPNSPFTDITGHWAYDAIVFCNDNGIMSGVGGGAFNPGGTLNRAMMATILYKLEGNPSVTYSPIFSDVPSGEWHSNAIVWAAGNGIVGGVGGGAFNPNGSITREQMATLLYNYAKYKGYDTSAAADLNGFPDAGAVSSWARDGINWCVAEGLVSGTGGKLNPVGTATRAECATIMQRFVENIS